MEFVSELGVSVVDYNILDEVVILQWPKGPSGSKYELQMQSGEGDWMSLSKALTLNEVKKKNIKADGTEYSFRTRSLLSSLPEWGTFTAPTSFTMPTVAPGAATAPIQMAAPTLLKAEPDALSVRWPEVAGANGYKLRFRLTGEAWTEVGVVLTQAQARKKNLTQGSTYHFSVEPVTSTEDVYVWSPQSMGLQPCPPAAVLSPSFSRSFPPALLSNGTSAGSGLLQTPVEALAGKTIAIYFSASWCGPCRSFSDQLKPAYAQAKAANLPFEVVLASCDHSEPEALTYFAKHPWLTIPYDHASREALAGHFKVSGIPRLVVMNADGVVVENSAVQGFQGLTSIQKWCSASTAAGGPAAAPKAGGCGDGDSKCCGGGKC